MSQSYDEPGQVPDQEPNDPTAEVEAQSAKLAMVIAGTTVETDGGSFKATVQAGGSKIEPRTSVVRIVEASGRKRELEMRQVYTIP